MPAIWHEKRGLNYRVFWYVVNKKHKRSILIGNNLDDALDFEAKKRRQVRREFLGLPPLPEDEGGTQIAINDFLFQYVKDRAAEMSAHTVDNFDRPACETLNAFAGAKTLSQFGPKEAHDYKVWLLTQAKHRRGVGYHPNTVRMFMRSIRKAFNHAMTVGHIKSNPFKAVPLPPAVPVGRVASDAELSRILDFSHPQLRELLYFLAHQGCRRGDAENLDWSRREVLPEGRWRFTLQGDSTKNRRDKMIVLHHESQRLLISMGGPKESGPVFTLTRNEVDSHWGKAKKAAGVTVRLRLHDLKVKFVNTALDHCLAPTTIMEATGNLSASSLGHYIKQGQSMRHDQIDQVKLELPEVVRALTL